MNTRQQDEQVVRLMAATDQGGAAPRSLVGQLRQRQDMQRRTVAPPARPVREPNDGWAGFRQTETQKRHHNRQVDTYHAYIEADYTQMAYQALEFRSFVRTLGTVARQEYLLGAMTTPGSLAEVVGEQMLLDSVERQRLAVTDIAETFRERALRPR